MHLSKYKMTTEKKEIRIFNPDMTLITVYRIIAMKNFDNVMKGDLGGWIESEINLSQEGLCWVYDESVVYGKAKIEKNAKVIDDSTVCDYATVTENSTITRMSKISDTSIVSGNAQINNSSILGESEILGNAKVVNSFICGTTDCSIHYSNQKLKIFGNATLKDVSIHGAPHIFDNAYLEGEIDIEHTPKIYGNCVIKCKMPIFICDAVEIFESANITCEYIDNKNNSLHIRNSVKLFGNCNINASGAFRGYVKVYGQSSINGKIRIEDECEVFGEARLYGKHEIVLFDKIKIYGHGGINAENKDILISGQKEIYKKTITRSPLFGFFVA